MQEIAETIQPNQLVSKKKPDGFEMQHVDKMEIINFDAYKLHFFTSLTAYTFIIVGQKDSQVPQSVYLDIYRALCDSCLKDPSYPVA